MRLRIIPPAVNFSTADVYDGLCYGLRANGVTLTDGDDCDATIVITGIRLRQVPWEAMSPVAVLFTETPYDLDLELELAGRVDAGWTHERAALYAFRAVNKNISYLPHAWHPERHQVKGSILDDAPSHDVIFVGSGFPERVTFLNAIDWTGIDLGLYGIWENFGLKESLVPSIKGGIVSNEYAAALYRRAKIGLNLHRRMPRDMTLQAESLNPRAYELAACGCFFLTNDRAEVEELFGTLVPTFSTPKDAESLIRAWLSRDAERHRVKALLPCLVAMDSWTTRARQVVEDLTRWGLIGSETVAYVHR